MMKGKKTSEESKVEMRQIVMPHHSNPRNTIFGGVVMSWIDTTAAMVAQRHSNTSVVTAHINSISFKAPIKVGDHVLIQAKINYSATSSMAIGVKVTAENPLTGECRHTTSAYLTFVALDDVGRPTPVPQLKIVSKEDKRRFEEARRRVDLQKALRPGA